MGRIDEALRRAGTVPPRDVDATGQRDRLFVAPWPVADESPAGQGVGERAPAPERSDSHFTSGSLLRLVRPGLFDGLSSGWRERLTGSSDCDAGLSEEFRHLAAGLFQSRRVEGVKTLLVTSAVPEDGKTLCALNLALVLSGSYRHRVLLIDADLRRPSIGQALNIRTEDGLSEGLRSRREQKISLVSLTENLVLLPAGRPDPDPVSGLTSPRMQYLLDEASACFDWVIVDTPPIAAAADAGLLCPMVNAALLVVRAGRTPFAAVQTAIEALGRDRILGVIFNGAQQHRVPEYYQYYHHHTGLDR